MIPFWSSLCGSKKIEQAIKDLSAKNAELEVLNTKLDRIESTNPRYLHRLILPGILQRLE
jgi:hypothetical protein